MKNEPERAISEYQLAAATVVLQKAVYGLPLQGLARLYLLREKHLQALHYAREASGMEPNLKIQGEAELEGKIFFGIKGSLRKRVTAAFLD